MLSTLKGFALKLALLYISVWLALFVADATCNKLNLHLEDWQIRYAEKARRVGRPADMRRAEEAVADLWRQGEDVYPYYAPVDFLGSPDLVSTLAAAPETNLIYAYENGYFMRFRADSRGFNNPPETESIKQVDYAFLGDSFTFGASVNQGNNFVDRFRSHNPNTLNFGVPASGPVIHYVVFRQFVEDLKPKVLVWNFISNDFTDMEKELNTATLTAFLDNPRHKAPLMPHRGETLRGMYKERFLETNKQRWPDLNGGPVWRSLRLYHLRLFIEKKDLPGSTKKALVKVLSAFTFPTPANAAIREISIPPVDPKILQTYRWILADVNKRVKSWNGKMYVYFDDWYAASFPAMRIAEELGIPILDISISVDKELDAKGLDVFRPGHYSETGYAYVGDLLHERLGKRPGKGL